MKRLPHIFLLVLLCSLAASAQERYPIRVWRIGDQVFTADSLGASPFSYLFPEVSIRANGNLVQVGIAKNIRYYTPAKFLDSNGAPWGSSVGQSVSAYQYSITTGSGGSSGSATTDASALTTGTLPDPRLSANVVKITGPQTLTQKTLTAPVINSPTGLVKGDVGLGAVDNTSDANKPVSSAQQTAINLKLDASTYNANRTIDQAATTNAQNTANNALSTANSGTATLGNKENSLGNPTTNGYILSSTTGGTRSWIAPPSGGGTVDTNAIASKAYVNPKFAAKADIVNAVPRVITYASTLAIPYVASQPNVAITLTGNTILSITGSNNGDGGLLKITKTTGSETITFGSSASGWNPRGTPCNTAGCVDLYSWINDNGVFRYDAGAGPALTLTTTGTGAASYNPATGGINIPTASGVDTNVVATKAYVIPKIAANASAIANLPVTQVVSFTTAGTYSYTLPAGAKTVRVILIGAGAGGGSGRKGAAGEVRGGGGGGQAGGRSDGMFDATTLPTTLSIVVGAKGTGGISQTATSTNGSNGVNGTASLFHTFMKANGGGNGGAGNTGTAGGGGGTNGLTYTGGNGSSSSSGGTTGNPGAASGTFGSAGGASGGGVDVSNVAWAGAIGGGNPSFANATVTGGTAGTTSGSGGNGTNGTDWATGGGSGGGSTTANGGDGGNGGYPGGGGGGGGAAVNGVGNSGKGGDGADGKVVLIISF